MKPGFVVWAKKTASIGPEVDGSWNRWASGDTAHWRLVHGKFLGLLHPEVSHRNHINSIMGSTVSLIPGFPTWVAWKWILEHNHIFSSCLMTHKVEKRHESENSPLIFMDSLSSTITLPWRTVPAWYTALGESSVILNCVSLPMTTSRWRYSAQPAREEGHKTIAEWVWMLLEWTRTFLSGWHSGKQSESSVTANKNSQR